MNLIVLFKDIPIKYLENERWLPITDTSVPGVRYNSYYISNRGRVYSFLSNNLLNPVKTDNGYLRVALQKEDGTCRYHSIHRILMIEFEFIPEYKEMQVNHKNCNKEENFDYNLEWCTGSENIIHAIENGLINRVIGEDCSFATITNEQAEDIAKLIIKGLSHKEISEIVKCPEYIISNISSGNTWKWVYKKYNLGKYKKKLNKFTDEELHKICAYIEDNINNYEKDSDLYRALLMDLFNLEYTRSLSATMSRIKTKQVRKDITCQYNMERFNDYPVAGSRSQVSSKESASQVDDNIV